MPERTTEELFQEAAAHHQAGRISAAEALYRQILSSNPDHAGALHWLGMILAHRGETVAAESLIQQSVRISPTVAFLGNHAVLLIALERFAEAEQAFARALSVDPANIELKKRFALFQFHLSERERTAGRRDAALRRCLAAIELDPDFYEALNNAANLLQETGNLGNLADSLSLVRRAARLRPDDAAVQFNLGNVLLNAGEFVEATTAYETAIRLNPEHGQAFNNLGNCLWARGLTAEAKRAYLQAARFMPDSSDIQVNVAIALHREGDLGGAINLLRRAISINPALVQAYFNLGNALRDAGQLEEAISLYRAGLKLNPSSENWSNLLFALHSDPSMTPAMLAAEHAAWNQAHILPLLNVAGKPSRDQDPDRPLRIGYLSADFREHPAGRFILPLLRHHDRRMYQVYCYSDVRRESDLTQTFKQYASVWRKTAGMSDKKLAELIEADQIDILVELSMHTEDNRLLALARKPAPVQVSYLAYCSTTGSDAIDYRFTDPYLDPTDADQPSYSEQSIRLRTYWCYEQILNAPTVSPLPATARGAIMFSCLNNCGKVSPGARSAWSQILRRVPSSRLILHTPQGSHRDTIRRSFAELGIEPNRIEFLGYLPLVEYLAAYNQIDIALDPFPYPGGTTTCDGLWMGVPIVTLAGQTAVSRGGKSILSQIGLTELIATDVEQYIATAIALAGDQSRLAAIRFGLRERMRQSPLMDQVGFARDVEQNFRRMWQRHCGTAQPTEQTSDTQAAGKQPTAAGAAELAARQRQAGVHHRQADDLRSSGQIDAAIAEYRAAFELDPSRVESLNNLGNLFQERGLHAQAVAALRRAAQVRPDLPELQFNLGNILAQAGQFDDAAAAYQRAIQLKPDFAQAFNNLGNAFRARGFFDEARVAYERAGSRMPNFGEAAVNIGIARMRDGDLAGAIDQFYKAIALMPGSAEAFLNLGNALKEAGQIDDALAAYRQALELQPTSGVWDNLLYALHFHPAYGPAELFKEHAAWNRACVHPRLQAAPRPIRDWNPDRPLRIGYVSADFREHPVGRFILPLLGNHDRQRFQIYCYSDVRRETEVTRTIKRHATVWRDTVGLTDEKLAELIAADQIDILVETSMHLEDNRMLALAYKPAPVQVTYLAYCSTTGSQAIDYRFTDPYLDPADADQQFYSEQSVRLRSYWCYVELIGAPPVGPPPSLINGYTTFGCLNSFSKASKPARQAWCEILRKNPDSRLILHAHAGTHRDTILKEFAEQGIDANRIEFVGFQSLQDYLSTYNRIDIALDPFPYPGGTTTCDALWMGVPVITLAGATAISRGGASVLATIGHPELIAGNTVQYVAFATKLAADLPKLQSLRMNLREQMRRSPLMDQAAFAKDAEQLYRQMWHRHTANLLFERGNQCQEQNNLAGAVEAYRSALAIRPKMAEAHNNLGIVLRATGQRELASAQFATAVEINPNYVDALSNHAVALREDGKLDDSIATARHALSVNPNSVPSQITLGNALMFSGDLDGAINCFRRVIATDPHSQAYDNLLYAINFHPRYDARHIAAELGRWEQIVARPAMALARTSHRNDRSPERRLRVGFVSPDFRDHTIGRFLLALFEHHDPRRIEIAAYAEVARPDWMTEKLRRHAANWRNTCGVRDDILAKQIEDDQIDILIDLAMHSDGSRLIAFTQCPAPVQATYLAYCGTTGLHSIDYRISDNFIDPPGMDESVYAEKTVRLETFWCYVPPPDIAEPAELPAGARLTFGCLNNFSKFNAEVLRCWAEILLRVDGSQLLIHSFEGAHRQIALNKFEALGVDPKRIEFIGPQKFKDYFASYSRIDIALDPFPFGGGTTTCDALWMGVPVITLVGRTAAGRGGASVLNQIDMPELIALRPGEYVDIAVDIAHNKDRRAWLRKNLRDVMSRSPLMDAPRFARSFESVCRSMWQRYCERVL